MTRKKAGGPVTATGKNIVSKNALKHGATSKRLLNDDENIMYSKLVKDLTKQYDSSNPLAKFQIERIARLNVQLQRIQDAIDADFEISRLQAIDSEKLPPSNSLSRNLVINGATTIQFNNQSKYSDITKKTYIDIATELIANNYSAIMTHEGFLNKCPKFCDYLFTESQLENLTIENFVDKKFDTDDGNWGAFKKKFDEAMAAHNPELYDPPPAGITKEQAIFNTNLHTIRKAAKWIANLKELILNLNKSAAAYKKLQEIKLIATIPDLDKLDRLMRYQTSLQRQLSTAMGELLAILEN